MSWLPFAGSGALLVAVLVLTRRRRRGRRRHLSFTLHWSDETEDAPDGRDR